MTTDHPAEGDNVDALLSDFFRAERPKVWPPVPLGRAATPAAPAESLTVPSGLAAKRKLGGWLTRGRATLAASAAFLLVAGLAVTPPDAGPRPPAPTPAGPSLLGGASAKRPAPKVLDAAKPPDGGGPKR